MGQLIKTTKGRYKIANKKVETIVKTNDSEVIQEQVKNNVIKNIEPTAEIKEKLSIFGIIINFAKNLFRKKKRVN